MKRKLSLLFKNLCCSICKHEFDENSFVIGGYTFKTENKIIRKYLGYLATVKFIRAPEGYNQREFLLQLDDINEGVITASFENGTEMVFNKSETAFIKLYYDFNSDD